MIKGAPQKHHRVISSFSSQGRNWEGARAPWWIMSPMGNISKSGYVGLACVSAAAKKGAKVSATEMWALREPQESQKSIAHASE
jgi:hypothetical protein